MLLEEVPEAAVAVEEVGVGYRVNRHFPDGEITGEMRLQTVEELVAEPVTRVIIRDPHSSEEEFLDARREARPAGHQLLHRLDRLARHRARGHLQGLGAGRGRRASSASRQADVLAIGDGRNDIEMLRWAGRGVAMGQAPLEVQEAADVVTETVRTTASRSSWPVAGSEAVGVDRPTRTLCRLGPRAPRRTVVTAARPRRTTQPSWRAAPGLDRGEPRRADRRRRLRRGLRGVVRARARPAHHLARGGRRPRRRDAQPAGVHADAPSALGAAPGHPGRGATSPTSTSSPGRATRGTGRVLLDAATVARRRPRVRAAGAQPQRTVRPVLRAGRVRPATSLMLRPGR